MSSPVYAFTRPLECLECGSAVNGLAPADGPLNMHRPPIPEQTVIACKDCGALYFYTRGPALRAFTAAERRGLGDLKGPGARKAQKLFHAKKPLHFYDGATAR